MKYTTACAIIINENNEILLTKRAREPFKKYWALISGIGESKMGEPSNVGVINEVSCDLGTKSFKGKFLFSLPINNDAMTDRIDVFVGKININEIKMNPIYSEGIKWVSANNSTMFDNLAFEHSKIIKKYLEKNERN